ncbi:MAG: O-antigen ligase family protein [Candidatus Omnitrophota bacterium]|nr:O-antigen ligase family protein [Candidatus Omnitrophota bacterium]
MSNKINNIFLFGLSILLIFAPVARGAVRIWSTSVVLLVEAFLIFLWLWRANNSNTYSFKRTKLDYPILIFAIIAVISFIFSIYKHDSFYALIKLFGYIGIYYLVVNEFDHDMRKKLVWLIISIGTAISTYGILQYLGILNREWWFPQGFLASTYVNHNHFAGYLELVIPLAIVVLIRVVPKESSYKLIVVPFLVIMTTAFILAQSRGAWFSLSISLAAMIVLLVKRGSIKRKNLIVILLLLAVVVSFIFFGKEVIAERLSSLSGMDEAESSAYTRFLIWQGTVKLIAHNPLIGCGIGDFIWAFPRFRPEGLNVQANFAHNDYLQAAAEMGVFAPLVMIWIFWTIVASVAKQDKVDPIKIGCATGILSLALHGLVDFNFHIPANMLLFTVFAAIVMSSSRSGEC